LRAEKEALIKERKEIFNKPGQPNHASTKEALSKQSETIKAINTQKNFLSK